MKHYCVNQIFSPIFSKQDFHRLFVKSYFFIFVLLISLGFGYIIAQNSWIVFVLLGLLIVLVLFIRNPELALAVSFNGTLIYFYSVYKLGFETTRLITAAFYGILAFSYLSGGFLLVAKRPQRFKFGSIDLLVTCFFILVFLSYFIFYRASESAYRKIAYAPLLVVAPYFGIQFLSSEKRLRKFLNYCVLLASVLIVPAFYELLFNPIFAEKGRFSMYVFARGEGKENPILFGITFGILLIILFVWIIEQRRLKLKYLVLILPSVFLLLRSGSRGAVLSLLISIAIYLFILKVRLRMMIYAMIFVVLLMLGAYRLIPDSTIHTYKAAIRTLEYRNMPIEEANVNSVLQRIIYWKQAIVEYEQNPIFGVGLGNSAGGSGSPHNIILEVGAELGVFGLLLFIFICHLTIKKAIVFVKYEQRPGLKLLMMPALLLFIYSLVEAMFSGNITQQVHLFGSIALVSAIAKIKPDSRINQCFVSE
jgi:O-antigen ligase